MKSLKLLFALSLLISAGLQAQQAKWELVRANLTGKIAIDPTNSDIIYVAVRAALNKSTDGGQTWMKYEQGYEIGSMKGIVIDPNNIQRLWIYGTPFKGIVRSEDGGITATQADEGISYDHHGYQVTALAYDHLRDVLYAGNQANDFGIYRSYDGGRSWEQVNRRIYTLVLMVLPDSGWIYVGGLQGSGERGISLSKDFGKSWIQLHPEILDKNIIWFLAKVPNSHTLYAAGLLGDIYKSYNLGENWSQISKINAANFDVLTGGFIVSDVDTNYVYAGSSSSGLPDNGGFFLSQDGGNSWQSYHAGLPDSTMNISSIVQSPDSDYLYISATAIYRLSQSTLTSVRGHSPIPPPIEFTLRQNYPNPFSRKTKIEFSLVKRQFIVLEIYNITGEQVARLVSEEKRAGNHTIIWDGKNSQGGDVANGIYLLRLQAENQRLIQKMLLTH